MRLERGEANVFFTSGFTDLKPNIIPRSIFYKVVEETGMSDTHCPPFSILNEVDSENPRPISLPGSDEETISPLEIDAVLRFPYCLNLVEVCRHYSISSTQLSSNSIRT